jgi:hypothetical protein
MLETVVINAGENRRAGMAQIISPAVAAVDGDLVGHYLVISMLMVSVDFTTVRMLLSASVSWTS